MKIRPLFTALALLGTLAVPSLASAAQTAFAAGGINMRAGPSGDYPVVARVVRGSSVNVFGCIRGYSWCDAGVQGVRGWVPASKLEFVYGGRRVLVGPQYYSYFAAPVVSFDFGYWDRYYAGRPFYGERYRYFPGHWRDRGGVNWREGDRSFHRGDRRDQVIVRGGHAGGGMAGHGRDRMNDGMMQGGNGGGKVVGHRRDRMNGGVMQPDGNGGGQMAGHGRDRMNGGGMQAGGNGGGGKMAGHGRDRMNGGGMQGGGKGGNRQRCPDGQCVQ
jgi:uncharacterized protein YraI